MSAEDVWEKASAHWDRLRPPFQPHPDDTAVVEQVASSIGGDGGQLHAVMLGVTPQTARCAWPAGTRLVAVDSSQIMIDRLWPASGTPAGAVALCADWSRLPFADASVDLVAADGSLVCCDYPAGFSRLLAEVRRVLKPSGRFVARTFLRPDEPERVEDILDDLHAGRIAGPYPLKMRFSMTFHEPGRGTARGKWREAWLATFPDQEASAKRFGWSLDQFGFPSGAGPDDFVYYPTTDELRAAIAPFFEEVGRSTGGYELAERCPTLVLAPIS